MCRDTNLSQWRSCSHNVAQNCFVGEGPVLGVPRGYLHMCPLVVHITPSFKCHKGQERRSLKISRVLHCMCMKSNFCAEFVCHLQQDQPSWVLSRNHPIDLGSVWYIKSAGCLDFFTNTQCTCISWCTGLSTHTRSHLGLPGQPHRPCPHSNQVTSQGCLSISPSTLKELLSVPKCSY